MIWINSRMIRVKAGQSGQSSEGGGQEVLQVSYRWKGATVVVGSFLKATFLNSRNHHPIKYLFFHFQFKNFN